MLVSVLALVWICFVLFMDIVHYFAVFDLLCLYVIRDRFVK